MNEKTIENAVLKDNNIVAIKHSPEFITNKNSNSPTNSMLTSLLKQRALSFILKYAIAYEEEMMVRLLCKNTSCGIRRYLLQKPL